jgi:hypothetical protein
MTLAISRHTGDYIPNIVLTPLEIIFNKPHPSILHITDATTRKVLILYLQEIKGDIIYWQAQLQELRREELHPCIQAHLISVINKICALLEYQGCPLVFRCLGPPDAYDPGYSSWLNTYNLISPQLMIHTHSYNIHPPTFLCCCHYQ